MSQLRPTRRPGLTKSQHVAAVLRDRIDRGEYQPGQKLPAEPELCDFFGYDRSTVRRGLAMLRQEGLVVAEQGRGVFVRQRRLVRHELLRVLRAEYEHNMARKTPERGLFELTTDTPDDRTQVQVEYIPTTATRDLAESFDVELDTDLLERRYLFVVDGEPNQLTRSYLMQSMIAGTELVDPANERRGRGTFAQLYDIGISIDKVSVDIQARMPTPDEAAALAITEGTPLLIDRRRSSSGDRVVAVADTITPADRIVYGLDLSFQDS